MENRRGEVVIDLRDLFYVLKSKLLIIIITGIVFAMGAGLISQFVITPKYQATSKLYILPQTTSITSLADIQIGETLTADYLELIKSRSVVDVVIDNLELNIDYEGLIGEMSVSNPTDTRILNISITNDDPVTAQQIANEFANVSKKQISKIMKTDEPSLGEKAVASDIPISPNIKKNVAIAMLVGLILAAGYFMIRHLLDDTVKSNEDVERLLDLNTLAMIPIIEADMIEMHYKKKKNKKMKGVKINVKFFKHR